MAGNIVAKIDGVNGSSQIAGHEGKIELLDLHFNVSSPISSQSRVGKACGAPSPSPVSFSVLQGIHSPQFFKAQFAGKAFPNVSIMVLMQAQDGSDKLEPHFEVKLKNAMVASMTPSTSASADGIEHVTLAYDEIKINYFGPGGKAVGEAGYNVQENKAV